jgi:hypothetical protein
LRTRCDVRSICRPLALAPENHSRTPNIGKPILELQR